MEGWRGGGTEGDEATQRRRRYGNREKYRSGSMVFCYITTLLGGGVEGCRQRMIRGGMIL